MLNADGINDRGTLSHISSLLLIGAMFLIASGIAALTYLTVERIARRRLPASVRSGEAQNGGRLTALI